jgi:translation initiation factor IF-3
MIRVPQVRVVDEEGSQLGVMPTPDAFRLAQERGLDLVEVAPMAAPPVTRLLDYGQFKYEQARREKEARRHQRSVDFKEIRIKPKIGRGDFETKVRRAIQFLEDGDRVKVTCQFRGREVSHAHLGRDLLMRFAELVQEHGTVERQPLLEGRSMSLVIASAHKPKSQRREEGAETETAARADGVAEAAAEQPAAGQAGQAKAEQAGADKPAQAEPKPERPGKPEQQAKPAQQAQSKQAAKPREPAVSTPARPAGG